MTDRRRNNIGSSKFCSEPKISVPRSIFNKDPEIYVKTPVSTSGSFTKDKCRPHNHPIKCKDQTPIVPYDPLAPFSFKVRDFHRLLVHRFSIYPAEGVHRFREVISIGLFNNCNSSEQYGKDWSVSYFDKDSDLITIRSDHDLIECIRVAQLLRKSEVELTVHTSEQRIKIVQRITIVQRNSNETLFLFLLFFGILSSIIIIATTDHNMLKK